MRLKFPWEGLRGFLGSSEDVRRPRGTGKMCQGVPMRVPEASESARGAVMDASWALGSCQSPRAEVEEALIRAPHRQSRSDVTLVHDSVIHWEALGDLWVSSGRFRSKGLISPKSLEPTLSMFRCFHWDPL